MSKIPAWALIAVAVAIVAAVAGYVFGHHVARLAGDAALAGYRAQVATEQAIAASEAERRLELALVRGNDLALQLMVEEESHKTESAELRKRIAHVTTTYIPTPGAAPVDLPRAVFTRGWVREYNAALGLRAGAEGAAAGGVGAQASATAAADAGLLLDSGLTEADILAHVNDYGQRCRNLESQVNRLIDWAQP